MTKTLLDGQPDISAACKVEVSWFSDLREVDAKAAVHNYAQAPYDSP